MGEEEQKQANERKSMTGRGHSHRTTRVRVEISAIIAALAGFLFAVVLYNDLSNLSGREHVPLRWGLIGRYVLSMVAGGAAAGYLLAAKFGRPGLAGWIWALLWGVIAILAAGFIGSLIGLLPERLSDGFQASDVIAVAAGGLILPFAANDWPMSLLFIPGAIVLAHLRARKEPIREHSSP